MTILRSSFFFFLDTDMIETLSTLKMREHLHLVMYFLILATLILH